MDGASQEQVEDSPKKVARSSEASTSSAAASHAADPQDGMSWMLSRIFSSVILLHELSVLIVRSRYRNRFELDHGGRGHCSAQEQTQGDDS